jgi:transcriptional regulator GlxA family with amidase domain
MSVRNFVRVFTADVGTTPARYVLHMRVEAARRLLESSQRDLKQVAAAVGFGNADVMRRAFGRVLGRSPSEFRVAAATVQSG